MKCPYCGSSMDEVWLDGRTWFACPFHCDEITQSKGN